MSCRRVPDFAKGEVLTTFLAALFFDDFLAGCFEIFLVIFLAIAGGYNSLAGLSTGQ